MSSFLAAFFASLSAISFPLILPWVFILVKVIVQLFFSRAIAFLLFLLLGVCGFCVFEGFKDDSAVRVYC
jgi:positive regulator of sigma E activity